MQAIHVINNVPTPELTVQNLLRKFKDLFSPELGAVKDVQVSLVKKESATPNSLRHVEFHMP